MNTAALVVGAYFSYKVLKYISKRNAEDEIEKRAKSVLTDRNAKKYTFEQYRPELVK